MDATIANVVLGVDSETHLPVGPLHVAAVFEATGVAVDLRDYQLSRLPGRLTIETLVDFLDSPADVLGVGCYYNLLPLLMPALDEIRRRRPEQRIVLGGPGPSAVAEPLLKTFPAPDLVVRGESEATLAELLPLLAGPPAAWHGVAGVTYRDGDAVVTTGARRRITDLGAIPAPAYRHADVGRYTSVAVNTARGCPFDCAFCEVAPLWGRRTRNRDVAAVVDEIAMLRDRYGVDYFRIADDTMTLSRRRVLRFAELMADRLPGVHWSCLGRVDLVDEGLISAMAAGGCIGIQYGVESGSPAVLDRVARGYDPATVIAAIEVSCAHFAHVVCTFIWGFPFETMSDFFMTVTMMARVAELGSDVKLLCLMPAPLSRLYLEHGDRLAFDRDVALAALLSGYEPTLAEEHAAIEEALVRVQSNPRVFPDFHHFADEHFATKHEFVKSLRQVPAPA